MARGRIYSWVDGQLVEAGSDSNSNESFHSVHGDEMPKLRHPVTGEIVQERTKWRKINKELGLQEVGNDLLSGQKHEVKDHITDEKIIEKVKEAESIMEDPFKRNQWRNMQMELYERNRRLLGGGR